MVLQILDDVTIDVNRKLFFCENFIEASNSFIVMIGLGQAKLDLFCIFLFL